jgi:hypothetical protein
MVAVTLQNGDAYVGILRACDRTVGGDERDIVLEEPAAYNEESADYTALPYQHLFVPAALVFCITVVHDPARDKRIVPVGASPFTA